MPPPDMCLLREVDHEIEQHVDRPAHAVARVDRHASGVQPGTQSDGHLTGRRRTTVGDVDTHECLAGGPVCGNGGEKPL